MHLNQITDQVINSAISIHRELGPGLLESVYEVVLTHELSRRGFAVERQVPIPITYQGLSFDEEFRCDILVERSVLLELKSVEATNKAHKKQLLTYLRLAKIQVGLLLNFGEELIKDGIHRVVNGFEE